ncbi:MAG: response regulator transcription factor [Duncaniella sp.]|nr:response regulator transcription factor [Duncaniella sp.]MDE5734646.1 response regulator transcription factor [Duncaniella sp.]MDE6178016.1 response regulator transcription factor [Duncaniella sp.]
MYNSSAITTPRILLVSGDDSLNAMLLDNLNAEGYEVQTVTTAEDALMLPLDEFNLIISEIDLPGEIDGFELLDRVKEDRLTAGVPLIFCTSRESENDLIKGLNSGADDFVTRPFSLREMMARIRSVLRRHRNMSPTANTRIIEFRTLLLNVDSHGLLIDGEAVSLSPTEFSLLTMLLRSRNKLFRREEIIAAIWPGEAVDNPRLVDVNISRLRKKLASYSKNLVNKSGLGYGFMDK